jgi:hypothetical protein
VKEPSNIAYLCVAVSFGVEFFLPCWRYRQYDSVTDCYPMAGKSNPTEVRCGVAGAGKDRKSCFGCPPTGLKDNSWGPCPTVRAQGQQLSLLIFSFGGTERKQLRLAAVVCRHDIFESRINIIFHLPT